MPDFYVDDDSNFPVDIEGIEFVDSQTGDTNISDDYGDESIGTPVDDGTIDTDTGGGTDGGTGGTGETNTLLAPTNITILSQTVKFGSDGTQFVDVVVGFTDVVGANNYEVRLTRL